MKVVRLEATITGVGNMLDRYTLDCKAGLLYFCGVFAAGFAFGGIRLMLLEPVVGVTWAVVIETPVILSVSWLLCARAVSRMQVVERVSDRILMGGCAFVTLLAAEYLLWIGLFGNASSAFVARYGTVAGLTGLLGQIAYAGFPVLQLPKRGRRD